MFEQIRTYDVQFAQCDHIDDCMHFLFGASAHDVSYLLTWKLETLWSATVLVTRLVTRTRFMPL